MMTPEQVAELESLSYFWDKDGSWIICEEHIPMVCLSVRFTDPNGPSVTELKRMRQWLPELAELSPAEARSEIGSGDTYRAGDFIGHVGRRLIERGQELKLAVLVQQYVNIFSTPVHRDGTSSMIIEDEEELEYIIQKMRDAGRPVTVIECD